MIRDLLSWGVVLLCVCVSAAAELSAEEAKKFQEAVDAYASGDFAASYSGFSELAKRSISPELCVNTGSSAYRNGDEGEAALWFRRAIVLDSKCAEAKQNLRFLKRRLGFLSFDAKPFSDYGNVLRAPVWRFFCALFTGIGAVGITAAAFLRMSRAIRIRLLCLSLVALVLGGIFGCGLWIVTRDRPVLSLHVVVATDATALAAPNNSAGRVVVLPPGTEVMFLEQRGAWVYSEIPGESRGWVRASQLKQLWPFSIRLIE